MVAEFLVTLNGQAAKARISFDQQPKLSVSMQVDFEVLLQDLVASVRSLAGPGGSEKLAPPRGWTIREYYYHLQTEEWQWERPVPDAEEGEGGALPQGWAAAECYYHQETQAWQWQRPVESASCSGAGPDGEEPPAPSAGAAAAAAAEAAEEPPAPAAGAAARAAEAGEEAAPTAPGAPGKAAAATSATPSAGARPWPPKRRPTARRWQPQKDRHDHDEGRGPLENICAQGQQQLSEGREGGGSAVTWASWSWSGRGWQGDSRRGRDDGYDGPPYGRGADDWGWASREAVGEQQRGDSRGDRGAPSTTEWQAAKAASASADWSSSETRTIKVTNVTRDVTWGDLQEIFNDSVGGVAEVDLEAGTAFVSFWEAEDARKAVQSFHLDDTIHVALVAGDS